MVKKILQTRYELFVEVRDEAKKQGVKLSKSLTFPKGTVKALKAKLKELTKEDVKRRKKFVAKMKGTDKDKSKALFDRLLKKGEFQTILSTIINTGQTLTDRQIEKFWNDLRAKRGKHILKIKTRDNGKETIVMANEASRDFIENILKDGLLIEEGEQFGSDLLAQLKLIDISSIKLERLKRPTKVVKNKDGKFFPYINTTDIDLSKYQIYKYDDDHKYREQCLIHTLKEAGIKQSLINQVKMAYIKGTSIRKKDIKDIANIIRRVITIHSIKPDGKIKKQKYNPIVEDRGDIDIAIYESHYFLFEKDTKYSKYGIDHYNEVRDEHQYHRITGMRNGKYTRSDDRKINSLLMIHKLLQQGKFKKMDMTQFEEASSHKDLRDHIYLDNIEEEQQLVGTLPQKKEFEEKTPKIETKTFYADFESFVNEDQDHHEMYLLGIANEDNDLVDILNVCDPCYEDSKSSPEQELIYAFMNILTSNGKQDALVYFHNLKYDYHLMELYLNIRSKVEKDNQLYSIKCIYKKRTVEFRDSYKMIPFPLSKFNKSFSLPEEMSKKEAIHYEYYTRGNNDELIECKQYEDLLCYKDAEIFNQEVLLCTSYDPTEKTFNPLTYYKEYLRLDCLVLKKGLEKMDETITAITDGEMSVYSSLTISSITDKYMMQQGAYKGVYEVQGNLRAYIAKAVYGGRVCCNQKYKKEIITGKISDYDGVSLYPSAINRLCRESGLPEGSAKRLTSTANWQDYTYSILTVKITKVNKMQQMPFIAHKSEGSIKYLNTPPPEPIIIDVITLQDYIKFHEIEYEILDGVYWDEGANKKMGEVIQRLFEERLKFKKSKPALANVIKLMLNSSYGKTVMKKSKTQKQITKSSKSKFENYVYNNFNTIKNYRKINQYNYEVEKICADNSYNRGHIGCAILSYSKRIMNEVFDIANTNDLVIYYTDTDSLHCNFDDVKTLEYEYEKVYNKQLNGKQLEQFHTDFDLDEAVGEIYATKSIFLGKKSYIDILESKNKDGETITGHHIRLKGITGEGLEHASKDYEDSYWGLYKYLSEGNTKKFILNPYNEDTNKQKVLFEYKEGQVSFKSEFTRDVKFT